MRGVEYTLSPHYPQHLVRNAFEVIAQWNDTFMVGQRALQGLAAPSSDASVACQSENPADYCFCGEVNAPEVRADNTCAHRSDYFVPPEMRGETDPFDCWIARIGEDGSPSMETDSMDPTNPSAFSDYTDEVYRYGFVGDECMLTLNVNSCDVPVGEGRGGGAVRGARRHPLPVLQLRDGGRRRLVRCHAAPAGPHQR